MRGVFWSSVLLYAAVLVVLWFVLPADGVVLHSGLSGPDRWGSRGEFITVMAAVGAGLTVLVDVIASRLISRVAITSPMVNLPHKAWWSATPERSARAQRMMTADCYVLGAGTMVFISLMAVLTQFADPWIALTTAGVGVLALLGWSVQLMTRRYRPDSTA
ncbi:MULTISPECIES: hypothetical protein [Prauserella salsuginis group]|uniref:DUF1648 domain-containing protein n=1 Tax=Prauserella salsuginis TaxID=387889 RepID=A0ABW6FX21_9PSEU|nr:MULTISPECIES: hypothetical protein [Prauserella salsuginis group]MCR3720542.1 hypothetical protein [Prauserella flava]MCR3733748.1 hypothetical protein [Prauserella salsuginis]